jgi:arylsulfatase A-like enzyme
MRGAPPTPQPIFAELLPATAWPHHAVMMVEGGRKLVHRVSDRRYELYDLRSDPAEKKNLADDPAPASREALASMKKKLLDFEERRR